MALHANLFAIVALLLAEPFAAADLGWPWHRWCNQSLVSKNNGTACVVETRNNLPTLVSGSAYDIYFGLHALSAGGAAADMLSLTHSVLVIRESGNTSGLRMLIEYAAVYFGPDAVLPRIQPDGTLRWKTEAVVAWYPEGNMTDWLAKANITHVGTVSSRVLGKWFEWVPQWKSKHPGYQPWAVWDRADEKGARRLLNESICHTFTEDGLISLYNLGARFLQKQPLCRNYFPLLSNSSPVVVDVQNSTVRSDVEQYYSDFDKILRRKFGDLKDFADTARRFLRTTTDHIYIHQLHASDRYLRAMLVPPYLAPPLYKPMVLPWQEDNSAKACVPDQALVENHQLLNGDRLIV